MGPNYRSDASYIGCYSLASSSPSALPLPFDALYTSSNASGSQSLSGCSATCLGSGNKLFAIGAPGCACAAILPDPANLVDDSLCSSLCPGGSPSPSSIAYLSTCPASSQPLLWSVHAANYTSPDPYSAESSPNRAPAPWSIALIVVGACLFLVVVAFMGRCLLGGRGQGSGRKCRGRQGSVDMVEVMGHPKGQPAKPVEERASPDAARPDHYRQGPLTPAAYDIRPENSTDGSEELALPEPPARRGSWIARTRPMSFRRRTTDNTMSDGAPRPEAVRRNHASFGVGWDQDDDDVDGNANAVLVWRSAQSDQGHYPSLAVGAHYSAIDEGLTMRPGRSRTADAVGSVDQGSSAIIPTPQCARGRTFSEISQRAARLEALSERHASLSVPRLPYGAPPPVSLHGETPIDGPSSENSSCGHGGGPPSGSSSQAHFTATPTMTPVVTASASSHEHSSFPSSLRPIQLLEPARMGAAGPVPGMSSDGHGSGTAIGRSDSERSMGWLIGAFKRGSRSNSSRSLVPRPSTHPPLLPRSRPDCTTVDVITPGLLLQANRQTLHRVDRDSVSHSFEAAQASSVVPPLPTITTPPVPAAVYSEPEPRERSSRWATQWRSRLNSVGSFGTANAVHLEEPPRLSVANPDGSLYSFSTQSRSIESFRTPMSRAPSSGVASSAGGRRVTPKRHASASSSFGRTTNARQSESVAEDSHLQVPSSAPV